MNSSTKYLNINFNTQTLSVLHKPTKKLEVKKIVYRATTNIARGIQFKKATNLSSELNISSSFQIIIKEPCD